MFLVCGEALFDFFMKEDSAKSLNFDARMGGSPYNVAVGLRRLGIDTALFTGMSNDFLGGKLLRAGSERRTAFLALVRWLVGLLKRC